MSNYRYAAERAEYLAQVANQEALRCTHNKAGTRDDYPLSTRPAVSRMLWTDPSDGYAPV